MRKLLFTTVLLVSMVSYGQQTYNLDKKGDLLPAYTSTQDTAIYKGAKYPVFKSRRGCLFIFYIKHNGRTFRRYIY